MGKIKVAELSALAAQGAKTASSTGRGVGYSEEERAEHDAILQEGGDLPDPPRNWGDLEE